MIDTSSNGTTKTSGAAKLADGRGGMWNLAAGLSVAVFGTVLVGWF